MIHGFREFEFDLPEALLQSMVRTFDSMEAGTLSHAHIAELPDSQGVYQLLLGADIVYIGKTDSEAGLFDRLARHAWAIQHRRNLNVEDVYFKALRVFVFTAIDLETQLIKHYRNKLGVIWNNSGFGSNDPGRNRDHTRAKPMSFDSLYPIDLDQPICLKTAGQVSAADALKSLRNELPYTVRAESSENNGRALHSDLEMSQLQLRDGDTTARAVLVSIISSLPHGWQATALAGRIILYKENADYAFGTVVARS